MKYNNPLKTGWNKIWMEYCDKVDGIHKIIRDRYLECGGRLMDIQGAYISGGQEASRAHIASVIGELEASMLFTQRDSIVKPKYAGHEQ